VEPDPHNDFSIARQAAGCAALYLKRRTIMPGPESSLTTTLSTLGNLGTLASVGLAAASFVQDKKAYAAINQKLDDLLKGQELIIGKIDQVYGEVKDASLKNVLLDYENSINAWYRDYVSLWKRARKDDENRTNLQNDTRDLVQKLKDCDNYLGVIHDAFMGEFPSLAQPYMAIFAEIIRLGTQAPEQSQYFHALARFERWLILQQKGFLLEGNRLKYQSPESKVKQILRDMEHVTHDTDDDGKQIPKLRKQAEYSAQFVAKLNSYTQKSNAGDKEDTDYLTFGLNTCDASDIFYLDTNPVVSDPGKIVVGLQLYRKHDWLAIKIMQASFKNGVVRQEAEPKVNDDRSGRRVLELINIERVKELVAKYRGGPSGYTKVERERVEEKVLEKQQIYIDLSSAEAPSLEVITGAKLFLRGGNWICLSIQAAKLNSTLTEIDESSRQWVDAPGPAGKPNEDEDFFTIQGTAKYISIRPLTPTPLAPLRGVKFWRDFVTGQDHRVNLSVKTGLCDIEHLWRKYDLPMLTGSEIFLLLSDGYTGEVTLRDSQGRTVTETGWALLQSKCVFHLTHTTAGKISFKTTRGDLLYLREPGADYAELCEFEWFPVENNSIILRANTGKFLRSLSAPLPSRNGQLYADQQSAETAERFQIVPVK
jgi:hypothetical protein